MKRFVIKNANGSEQYVMPAVHDTYKSATQTLLHYLTKVANDMADDSTESPFNYIIEEVNERITDFEKARQALKLKPNISFGIIRDLKSDTAALHGKISRFAKEINPKHLDALIALNKLFTIAAAWNKLDGFVPDFSNWSQEKWIPWFKQTSLTGKLDLRIARSFADVNRSFGPRLCFKTRERAIQFGDQFVDLYNDVFLS